MVLITGGTGDLGQWVVEAFLAQGDRVHVPVFAPGEAEGLRERLGDRAHRVRFHMEADLTRPESVRGVFEAVEAEGEGPPLVLLNLAGGFTMAPLEETEPHAWDRMWRMNATTAFLCARQGFPGMREAGWGRIVNVSAFPALELGSPGLSAYGAAKAAVLNLTRTLAREGVEDGITVNAVLPSIIDTPGNRSSMPDQDRSTWLDPSEIAGVFRFLASEEARIVNGSALTLTLG